MNSYRENTPKKSVISGGYWAARQQVNHVVALEHQWQQLEASGCIDNFRFVAGQAEGFREGFFFADSDAYKWLEAAVRCLGLAPDSTLQKRVDEFIALLGAAQEADGYLYTYNQLHFPGRRWVNLQVEHELYCLGHLIEAGVSHFEAGGGEALLEIAKKTANLLLKDFIEGGHGHVDGHEEVEIALIRLYRVTRHAPYMALAARLLDRRGRSAFYAGLILPQLLSTLGRMRRRDHQRKIYQAAHPGWEGVRLPPRNVHHVPRTIWPRLLASLLSGKFTQSHAPLADQHEAVGHAVRFVYLQTALAMLTREHPDTRAHLLTQTEALWEKMIERRMYASGGLGALPFIEGFGRDYELDPQIAYAETCAALGSLFWNRELALITGKPQYDDLFEWQLYNAASVGMSLDGRSYLYNNPLASRGEVQRAAWYDCPCCPSNLSRTWAWLGQDAISTRPGVLRINQYITSRHEINLGGFLRFKLESGLPWDGEVNMRFESVRALPFALELRLPAWAGSYAITLNDGDPLDIECIYEGTPNLDTACGYDPRRARLLRIDRTWRNGDLLNLRFEMPIRLLRQDKRLPGCGGQLALGRGPLLYCLESLDNPHGVFDKTLVPNSVYYQFDPDLLDGSGILCATTPGGEALTFIPYMLWGNRGPSEMNVFINGKTNA